jgi:hypothetical protein
MTRNILAVKLTTLIFPDFEHADTVDHGLDLNLVWGRIGQVNFPDFQFLTSVKNTALVFINNLLFLGVAYAIIFELIQKGFLRNVPGDMPTFVINELMKFVSLL